MSLFRNRALRVGAALAALAGVVTLSGCVVAPAYPAGVYVRPAPVVVTPYGHHHHHAPYYRRHPHRRW